MQASDTSTHFLNRPEAMSFLPKGARFWQLSAIAWIIFTLISASLNSLYNLSIIPALIESCVFSITCTTLCLFYRYFIFFRQRDPYSPLNQLFPIVIFSLIASGIIAFAWTPILTKFLFPAFIDAEHKIFTYKPERYTTEHFIGRWNDFAFITMTWLALYTGISCDRQKGRSTKDLLSQFRIHGWRSHFSVWILISFNIVSIKMIYAHVFDPIYFTTITTTAIIIITLETYIFFKLFFKNYGENVRFIESFALIFISALPLSIITVVLMQFVEDLYSTYIWQDPKPFLLSLNHELPTLTKRMSGMVRQMFHCHIAIAIIYLYIRHFYQLKNQEKNNQEENLQKSTPLSIPRKRSFWIPNLLAWCLLEGIVVFLDAWKTQLLSPSLNFLLIIKTIIVGAILSLGVRFAILSNHWFNDSPYTLIARTSIISILMGGAMLLLDWYGEIVLFLGMDADHTFNELFSSVDTQQINQIFYSKGIIYSVWFAVWGLVYAYVVSSQKRILIELDRAKLEKSAKEAEFSMLASQLDPHFIFNSLNCIRALVRVDAEKCRNAIALLSDTLRYTLKQNRETKVILHDEIALIRRYVELFKFQLEDKLIYVEEIDIKTQNILIPPMMLHILIENAIKHGISQLAEGGKIILSITQQSQQLCCVVTNSGTLDRHNSDAIDSCHIGVKNIQDRLDLLYAGKASFSLNESDASVVATLEIPLETSS